MADQISALNIEVVYIHSVYVYSEDHYPVKKQTLMFSTGIYAK